MCRVFKWTAEPKTPYILYDSSNDELLGHTAAIEPIELTEAILNDTKATADQWDAQDTERPEPQTQLEPSKDMNTESHKSYMNEDNGDIDAAYSDRDVDEHKMFQEKRNSHYDMREAMERSRKLLAEENEDD